MRIYFALMCVCVGLFAGCGDGGKAEIERERQRAEQAERETKEIKDDLKKVEEKIVKVEEGRSTWQMLAFGAIGLIFIALIVGTALGSSAKKEAVKKPIQKNE